MKTIRRVTVNKDGRSRWKKSTRDRVVHRVSIRRGDETTWNGGAPLRRNNNGTGGVGAQIFRERGHYCPVQRFALRHSRLKPVRSLKRRQRYMDTRANKRSSKHPRISSQSVLF